MASFLVITAGGFFVLAVICVILLWLRLKAVESKPNLQAGNELNEWLRLLVSEPDHLSNLIEFAHGARSDPSLLIKGPETIDLFVKRLEEMDLHQIGPNGVVEKFDLSRHRSAPRIPVGADVRVVRSGWRHDTDVLRPSWVEPVSSRSTT